MDISWNGSVVPLDMHQGLQVHHDPACQVAPLSEILHHGVGFVGPCWGDIEDARCCQRPQDAVCSISCEWLWAQEGNYGSRTNKQWISTCVRCDFVALEFLFRGLMDQIEDAHVNGDAGGHDWGYLLDVNLLNAHNHHYTRDGFTATVAFSNLELGCSTIAESFSQARDSSSRC